MHGARFRFASFIARVGLLLAIASGINPSITLADPSDAASALARLRALAGEWHGNFQWTGARTAAGAMNANYYVTGNNSAIVENLIMEGVPTMTSVYHLDGGDLRMTHFCAAANQPRLKAKQIDIAHGVIEFDFLDVTNLSSPEAGHVTGLEIRLLDNDHLALNFRFQGGSKESHENITLTRVSKSS